MRPTRQVDPNRDRKGLCAVEDLLAEERMMAAVQGVLDLYGFTTKQASDAYYLIRDLLRLGMRKETVFQILGLIDKKQEEKQPG